MKTSTNRLGKIGETAVIHDLIKNYEYPLYMPVVDDVGVDLIVDRGDKFFKVQIKTVSRMNNTTAIELRLVKYSKNAFDVIAVYFAPLEKVAYVRYNNENHITLAIHRARNSQNEKRKWFYQYMEFPIS